MLTRRLLGAGAFALAAIMLAFPQTGLGSGATPVAVDDAYAVDEDGLLQISQPGLVGNDTDAEGDLLFSSLETPALHGSAAVGNGGALTYVPDNDFHGTDTFTYVVFDGTTTSEPATVTITVNPVNDPPVGTTDAAFAAEDGPAVLISPLANDKDVDGDPMEIARVASVAGFCGSVEWSAPSTTITYTPTFGSEPCGEIISYDVTDGSLDDTNVWIEITYSAIFDPPVAFPDTRTVLEDGLAFDIDPRINDVDPDTFPLSLTEISGESLGSVTSNGNWFNYVPSPNAFGIDTLDYTVADEFNELSSTVTITVTAVNDAPTFTAAANPTFAEDSGARTLTGFASGISKGPANEVAQTLSFSVSGNTNPGLFSAQPAMAANGTLTFTPGGNKHGTATFTVRLTDSGGTANGGVNHLDRSVTITITPVNDPPNAANDVGVAINQNATAVPIPVLANDTALPDTGETLDITAASAPGHGTVTITGGGTGLTYTPAATYRGSDLFTYTLSDGTLTDTATVLLEVVPAGTVTRLSGADRYATSAAISTANYAANVPVVYIATGLGFADALSGAPVAGKLGGPILLVPGTSIPTVTRTELTRLKPAKIVILGGTGAVSGSVATALDAYTTGTVTRLSGADRYATSAAISTANYAANVPVVYIATGLGFADALSGAPVAGKLGGPILLVPGTSIPTSVAIELTRLKPAKIVILGGTGAVSVAVGTSLGLYTTGP